MAEKGDPFEVHPIVKQAIQQSTVGMEQYFEFLKKNLASFPTGGTELGEKLKQYTDRNLTSFQEFLKSLSGAKDFPGCSANTDRVHAFAIERLC